MGLFGTIFNSIYDSTVNKPFQKGFWFEQQEYNTPANQVKRLQEAGINPQLAVGNIQSGQGASVAPVSNVANSGVTDSILGLINNKKQQNVLDAEAKLKNANAFLYEIDSFTRFAKNLQEIKESMSRESWNKMDETMKNVLGTAEEQLMRSMTANNASQNEINWLNYAKGLQELYYLPIQQRTDYLERMANIAQIEAVTDSEKERKKLLMEQTNHEFFKARGQRFVNDLNRKTEQFLIRERRLKGVPKNPYEFVGAGVQETYDNLIGE